MLRKRKLLRKQMELLAEQSKSAVDEELANLSTAMCEIYRELNRSIHARLTLFSVVGLELLVGIVILVEKCLGG